MRRVEKIAPTYRFKVDFAGSSLELTSSSEWNLRVMVDMLEEEPRLVHGKLVKDVTQEIPQNQL